MPDGLSRDNPPPPAKGGHDLLPRTTLLVIWPHAPSLKASVAMPLWMNRQLSMIPPGRCWAAVDAAFTKMQLRIVDGPAPLVWLL